MKIIFVLLFFFGLLIWDSVLVFIFLNAKKLFLNSSTKLVYFILIMIIFFSNWLAFLYSKYLLPNDDSKMTLFFCAGFLFLIIGIFSLREKAYFSTFINIEHIPSIATGIISGSVLLLGSFLIDLLYYISKR